jgi:hypothetical protein
MLGFMGRNCEPTPNPQAGGPLLLGRCDCIFSIFALALHPQPEDAPCRGDMDPLNMSQNKVDGHFASWKWMQILCFSSLVLPHICASESLTIVTFASSVLNWWFTSPTRSSHPLGLTIIRVFDKYTLCLGYICFIQQTSLRRKKNQNLLMQWSSWALLAIFQSKLFCLPVSYQKPED